MLCYAAFRDPNQFSSHSHHPGSLSLGVALRSGSAEKSSAKRDLCRGSVAESVEWVLLRPSCHRDAAAADVLFTNGATQLKAEEEEAVKGVLRERKICY